MKGFKLTIGEKEYTFGYENRSSVRRAEKLGVNVLGGAKSIISQSDALFYSALIDKQPETTQEEADKLIDTLINEGKYSYDEIVTKIMGLFETFYIAPQVKVKGKTQPIDIIEV